MGASALLLSGDLPEQAFDQNHFEYVFMLAKLPVLWLVSAVAVGELTRRHRQRMQEAQEAAKSERSRADELTEAYNSARATLDRLQEHVATEVSSATAVLTIATNLDQRAPEQTLEGAVEAVRRVLEPRKFSIAFLQSGQLVTTVQEGWSDEDSFPHTIPPDEPLFQALVGEGRRVIITEPSDEPILAGHGIIAVPLYDPLAARVIGMLKIEDLDFSRLTFAEVELVTTLGNWIGATYAHAVRYDRTRKHSMIAEDLPVYSRAFLEKLTAVFKALAKRQRFPVALLRVYLNPKTYEPRPEAVAEVVSAAIASILRETDLAFTEEDQVASFVILLPLADEHGAAHVRDRLRKELIQRLDHPADSAFLFEIESVAIPEREASVVRRLYGQ